MGFATGMKRIQQATASKGNVDFPKRLKLEDGDQVVLRIINEFDMSSPHYEESRGLAGVVRQHTSPYLWYKKAECTMEDYGQCYACEQAQRFAGIDDDMAKKWRSKQRLYFNLLAKNAEGEDAVFYWDTSTYRSSVYDTLWEYFLDTNSVSNRPWKLKRKGGGQNDTTYLIMAQAEDKKPFDWPADIKPYPLEDLVPTIEYDKQAEFYGAPMPVDDESDADESSDSLSWV